MRVDWRITSGQSADHLTVSHPLPKKRGRKAVPRMTKAEDAKQAEVLKFRLLRMYPDYTYKQFAELLGWGVPTVTMLFNAVSQYPRRVSPAKVNEALTLFKVTV